MLLSKLNESSLCIDDPFILLLNHEMNVRATLNASNRNKNATQVIQANGFKKARTWLLSFMSIAALMPLVAKAGVIK